MLVAGQMQGAAALYDSRQTPRDTREGKWGTKRKRTAPRAADDDDEDDDDDNDDDDDDEEEEDDEDDVDEPAFRAGAISRAKGFVDTRPRRSFSICEQADGRRGGRAEKSTRTTHHHREESKKNATRLREAKKGIGSGKASEPRSSQLNARQDKTRHEQALA